MTNNHKRKKSYCSYDNNLQDALTYRNRILLLHQGEIVGNFSEKEKKKLSVTDLYKIMVELDEKDN